MREFGCENFVCENLGDFVCEKVIILSARICVRENWVREFCDFVYDFVCEKFVCEINFYRIQNSRS